MADAVSAAEIIGREALVTGWSLRRPTALLRRKMSAVGPVSGPNTASTARDTARPIGVAGAGER